jgi:hypothetical protein
MIEIYNLRGRDLLYLRNINKLLMQVKHQSQSFEVKQSVAKYFHSISIVCEWKVPHPPSLEQIAAFH